MIWTQLRHVTKSFPIGARVTVALRDVSLDIVAGEFIVIVGPNGSGKTTLLRLIAGEVKPTSGLIAVMNDDEGAPSAGQQVNQLMKVSRVHQAPHAGTVGELTVLDNLRLASIKSRLASPLRVHPSASDRARFAKIAAGKLQGCLEKRVSELSQGQRQILAMEMALLRDPTLLLLDEHTASLDEANALECLTLTDELSKNGMTILMVTHNFSHAAKYGNRLIVLREGSVNADVSGSEKRNLTAIDVFTLCGFN